MGRGGKSPVRATLRPVPRRRVHAKHRCRRQRALHLTVGLPSHLGLATAQSGAPGAHSLPALRRVPWVTRGGSVHRLGTFRAGQADCHSRCVAFLTPPPLCLSEVWTASPTNHCPSAWRMTESSVTCGGRATCPPSSTTRIQRRSR